MDEERHIGAALDALARQNSRDFEVIVVDAGSVDATVPIVRATAKGFPVPLRLELGRRAMPIGEARNRGVDLSGAPAVAFLSADAEADTAWVQRAVEGLRTADVVFGLQVHDPHLWTTSAAVRGLRYFFPAAPSDDGQLRSLRMMLVLTVPAGTSTDTPIGALIDRISR